MRTIPLGLETGRALPKSLERLYLHLQVFIGSTGQQVESGGRAHPSYHTRDAKRGLLHAIIRQAEMSVEEFLDLL